MIGRLHLDQIVTQSDNNLILYPEQVSIYQVEIDTLGSPDQRTEFENVLLLLTNGKNGFELFIRDLQVDNNESKQVLISLLTYEFHDDNEPNNVWPVTLGDFKEGLNNLLSNPQEIVLIYYKPQNFGNTNLLVLPQALRYCGQHCNPCPGDNPRKCKRAGCCS